MPIDFQRMASDAQAYTQSEDFQKIMPYLLSGGAGALAGGLLSGKRREEKEGRLGYLGRILRNAAVTGGLAAGGHALINKGLEKTVGPLKEEGNISGATSEEEGPLSTTIQNIAFSPLTAAGAGATALGATHKNKLIGAGNQDRALGSLGQHLGLKGKNFDYLRDQTPEDIGKLVGADSKADRLRRLAGLASDSGLASDGGEGLASGTKTRGILSKIRRTGPGSTFGQTWPRLAGRGALGLAAAGLPALLGAILTNDNAQAA